MPAIIQDNRSIKVYSALPDNTLLFSSLSGSERLSTLFNYQLSLISENNDVMLDDLLGTDVTVEVELQPSGQRHFHGFISNCSQIGSVDEFTQYEFTLRPWFWFLTRTSDCRIFQEMSVPDIIMQVLGDEGFTDYENTLTESYEPWTYCVQYRETDFNFLSRLMEQEGIYYYFKHENGSHNLVLCDSISAHDSLPEYEEVPYYPVGSQQMRERDSLNRWTLHKQLEPGKFVVNDFNFKTPKADLLVSSEDPGNHARADYEIYDYPGEYPVRATGESAVKIRREESQAQHEIASGSGDVQGLCTGNLFTLTNCDREDQNKEYLIIHSDCSIHLDDYTSGGSSEMEFHCDITAISSSQPYRAPRVSPKPMVQGPQTAIVVGPAGDEIWTDEYGRVKLQFHWDRYGGSDENSSCWVRVSQVWAGQGWGAMHIPRIGHEVIVEFLEGDPDRPIITGRVYNGDNGVPYELPANSTQSGIKSRSSKSGTGANFNEIRMEDKKGSEELYVHAEKDQNNIVENNETTSVGNDRSENVGHDETISIANDRKEDVGNNETISIGNNRDETVGVNESVNIGANRSVTVGMNKTETVKVNKTETIGIAKELTIGGIYTITVTGNVVESYKATLTTKVGGDNTQTIGKNQVINVDQDQKLTVSKNQTTSISDDQTITIGKNLVIDAGDQITIKTGKASITMKKDGSIDIKGKDININASGAIDQKASKNIVIKGKKILQN